MRADLRPNSHAARLQFSVLEPCLCKVRLPLLWRHSAIDIEKDDVFLLATDGVYEHISNRFAAKTIHEHPQDLNEAAENHRRGGAAARRPGQSQRCSGNALPSFWRASLSACSPCSIFGRNLGRHVVSTLRHGCSVERCAAEPGPITAPVDPGSAAHHAAGAARRAASGERNRSRGLSPQRFRRPRST